MVYSIKKGADAELIVSTLLKREELGSTGIGKGIAIPHCRSLAVDKLEIAVGRTTKPINFNAIDKKPVSLIFLIIAPPQDPGNQYLITLGKIDQIAKEIRVTMIKFNPGARNVFHTHTGEQVLYVTEGKGIVANEDEEFLVTQGTAIYIPPGERHWHGATEDSSFSHLSILRPGETKF